MKNLEIIYGIHEHQMWWKIDLSEGLYFGQWLCALSWVNKHLLDFNGMLNETAEKVAEEERKTEI